MNQQQLRINVLQTFGASNSEITELLVYNQNVFDHNKLKREQIFLPQPEPYIAVWDEYAASAAMDGADAVLKRHLVQFQFPVVRGISETDAYRAATLRGQSVQDMAIATGLILTEPKKLQLWLYQSLAGKIPVIIAGNREDFVTLVQALTKRNEPQPIPDSMGACIVSGYNNWGRVRQYQQQWNSKHKQGNHTQAEWAVEFQLLIRRKELYQDQFIILSPSSYSNVAASSLGLNATEWEELSLKIRLEHECTHYFTRRFLGSMRNNILDELIADYRGIVAAVGHYRADWFLHFVGLESFPVYRRGGRLQNYQGEPPLSEDSFRILQALVKSAAENIECFDQQYSGQQRSLSEQVSILLALTTLTLEELASVQGKALLEAAVSHQRQLFFASLKMSDQLHWINANGNHTLKI
ncbi:hypothetical protein G7B40_010595 [Aetokthonos hydrillicola Thurmond2011]|jgi:hypothetical protein|uniref:Uncharacterized protein n=2 Tax=Aetokthonos TaxID=1550243 RepID=A0AAP5I4S2_9CYAN|nr:hypothetical protein [Aetokthonos hydrillicola]MBW4590647.1 hypothetical protein [Aetokthonos hydrillicola CCALA 1050]MDR9895013.1 hypothetical protein [Aetokthonos hydrillicola Thurmond2011]